MQSQKALQEYVRNRRRVSVLYLTGVFMICLMLVFYIYQDMQMREIQMSIARLQKDTAELQEKIETRQAERASLGNLQRIEDIATRKLGMGLPAQEQMWYIPVSASSSPGN